LSTITSKRTRTIQTLMLSALLYLQFTSLKNLLRSRLKRLRQPKYLFGALVGVAYFWFFFFGPLNHAREHATLPPLPGFDPTGIGDVAEGGLSLAAGIGGLVLLLLALLAWVLPTEKPGLLFTEAEIAFLFPAPLTRRALIHFKLVSGQLRILFTALFFTLLSRSWGPESGNALTHAVGWWVILSAISLHASGAVLTLARLGEDGPGVRRRRLMVLAGAALVVAATLAWVWAGLRAPSEAEVAGFGPLRAYAVALLYGGALGWVLLPFRLLVGPFLADGAGEFFLALGPALALLGALYFWVMRMNAPFEEGSLALAEKRGAMLTAMREGKRVSFRAKTQGRPAPFRLAGTGRPELAFLWKNLLAVPAWLNLRTLALSATAIVIAGVWAGGHPEWRPAMLVAGTVTGFAMFYILLLGPQLARQDLRQDLPNLDIIKIYPLRGWQVLLGELLAPTAILSGLLWLALLAAVMVLRARLGAALPPGALLVAGLAAVVVVPPLVAVQLLVPNTAAVMFPAWAEALRAPGAGGGGIDVMGQRLIFVLGQMLVLVLAMLPVVAIGLLGVLVGRHLVGLVPAAMLSTLAMSAMLAAEVAVGVWLLGEDFEQLDLSAELRP
jgi:ABC-2 type transport system permease protein